jgi:hypothetical protein
MVLFDCAEDPRDSMDSTMAEVPAASKDLSSRFADFEQV